MTNRFANTAAATEFVATANARETSPGVMQAIVAFADSADEADEIWREGLENWNDEYVKSFIDIATKDRTIDVADLCWGATSGVFIVPLRLRHDYVEA